VAERSSDDSSLGNSHILEPYEGKVSETRDAFSASVPMRSVDDWPLAKILFQISGGKLWSVSVVFSM